MASQELSPESLAGRIAACTTIPELVALANELHNPGLVDPDAAPNGNIIHKLWSDGGVTYEKGGFAYGQRSVHNAECLRNNPFKLDCFAQKFERERQPPLSYVICTEAQALALLGRARELGAPK